MNKEIIEKYLDGLLSPEEAKEVEELIKVDSDFAAEVQLSQNINEAIIQDDLWKFRKKLLKFHANL